jgi:hypothetical protein
MMVDAEEEDITSFAVPWAEELRPLKTIKNLSRCSRFCYRIMISKILPSLQTHYLPRQPPYKLSLTTIMESS